jgi:epoxide hydrolase-like predicted phosphatase
LSEKDLRSLISEYQKVRLYKIKHFIFDFGGVLIEKSFVLKNLLSIIEQDLKIKLPDKDTDPHLKKLRRRLSSGIISAREFLNTLFEEYYYPNQKRNGSLPPKKVNIEYYLELWFNLYTKVTNFSYEMAEIVEQLHEAGYIVSLMSNTYDIHARSNELRGFYDIFDYVFLSNEIGYIKPDMEKYKHVLKKLDTKPKKCVFIDDKLTNLIPARQLGFIVIRFESLKKFKLILKKIGIEKIKPNLRKEIKKKYKKYKSKKKEYKKAKKQYKKAKKEYLKKKHKKSKKKRAEYLQKRMIYKKKKEEFKIQKRNKKELISEFKIEE